METNPLTGLNLTAGTTGPRTPSSHATHFQLCRDTFVSNSSPDINTLINPKKIGSLDASSAVLFSTDAPGVSKVWEIDLGPDKSEFSFVRPDFTPHGICVNRNGTTRMYDYNGKKIWETETGSWNYSKTVSDNAGNLYLVGEDSLVSLNSQGNIRWKDSVGKRDSAHAPAVHGDRVYLVGADKKITGYTTEGEKLFQVDNPQGRADAPFVDANGLLHFTANSPGMERQEAVIDIKEAEATGTPVIKPVCLTGLGQPALVTPDGTLINYRNNHVFARDPQGTIKWKAELPGKVSPAGVISTQKIGPDGDLYVSVPYQGLFRFEMDGTRKWSFTEKADQEPLSTHFDVAADGTLFIAGAGKNYQLYAFNPDGTRKWTIQDNEQLQDVKLGPDGTVYCRGYNGRIKAFHPDDGSRKFEFGGDGNRFHFFQVTEDNDIIATTARGKMIRIHHTTPEEFVKEKAEKASSPDTPPLTVEEHKNGIDIGGVTLNKRKKKLMNLSLRYDPAGGITSTDSKLVIPIQGYFSVPKEMDQ